MALVGLGSLLLLAGAAGTRPEILARLAEVMGPLPGDEKRVPIQVETLATETLDGCRRIRLQYLAEPGDWVPAYLFIPNQLEGQAPGVLCLHQTTSLGKGEPAGFGDNTDLHYALELARRGYVTFAPDYPNFGDSVYDPYAHGYVSATMKGIWNHLRAVDLLQSLPEVNPERIGCVGHSLGGHNSLFVAAFDPRIKAVVTSCGFTSFAKYKGGDLTGWTHAGYMPRIASVYGNDPARMPFDFSDILLAIAPRRVFINAPLHDDNFDPTGVDDCVALALPAYQAANAADHLAVRHPDAGHSFPPEVRALAWRHLDEELRPITRG